MSGPQNSSTRDNPLLKSPNPLKPSLSIISQRKSRLSVNLLQSQWNEASILQRTILPFLVNHTAIHLQNKKEERFVLLEDTVAEPVAHKQYNIRVFMITGDGDGRKDIKIQKRCETITTIMPGKIVLSFDNHPFPSQTR